MSAPALTLINLEKNKLDALPAELANLKKLKTLLLADNPLDSKLAKILSKGGPTAIKDLQNALKKAKK